LFFIFFSSCNGSHEALIWMFRGTVRSQLVLNTNYNRNRLAAHGLAAKKRPLRHYFSISFDEDVGDLRRHDRLCVRNQDVCGSWL
jgi:hypothetical protein